MKIDSNYFLLNASTRHNSLKHQPSNDESYWAFLKKATKAPTPTAKAESSQSVTSGSSVTEVITKNLYAAREKPAIKEDFWAFLENATKTSTPTVKAESSRSVMSGISVIESITKDLDPNREKPPARKEDFLAFFDEVIKDAERRIRRAQA